MSLIDRKGISSADKLHFLKKYVTGSAHKCLEGTFYRNDEAYRDAWKKLDQRYGQPFVVQRAFREAVKMAENKFQGRWRVKDILKTS